MLVVLHSIAASTLQLFSIYAVLRVMLMQYTTVHTTQCNI